MRFGTLQGVMAFSLALASCGTAALPAEDRPAAAGEQPFKIAEVARFDTPWAMTFLGGPLALVSEKDGRLWVVNVDDGSKTAVSGVPQVKVAGQGGLGDVVFGPGRQRRVYLSFVEAGPDGTSGAAVGYGQLVATAAPGAKLSYSLQDFKIVWRQAPKVTGAGHFSHRIAFGPDGAMYVSSGDRQKGAPAQATDGNLGKVLRLTPEGQPFPGNPWAAKGGVEAQYFSTGHRNVLGLAIAPDGRLWQHEMGPQGGDEVNLIVGGRNYGWPTVSNGSEYGGKDIPDHSTRPEFEAPKVWWNPSISPAGLIVYTGNLFPQWKGDLLLGALSGESLIRVDVNGDKASKAERWNMGARIREVEQGPKGEVYLLEDGGRLLRLTPAWEAKGRGGARRAAPNSLGLLRAAGVAALAAQRVQQREAENAGRGVAGGRVLFHEIANLADALADAARQLVGGAILLQLAVAGNVAEAGLEITLGARAFASERVDVHPSSPYVGGLAA